MIRARRPLARRWRAPLFAAGFCLGEAFRALAPWGLAIGLAAPALARARRSLGVGAGLLGFGCVLGGVCAFEPWRDDGAPVAEAPLRYTGVVEESWTAPTPDARPAAELVLRLEGPDPGSGLSSGDRMQVAVWRRARRLAIGERVELVARARAPRGLCNGGRDGRAAVARREAVRAEASVGDGRALSRLGMDPAASGLAHAGRVWRSAIREAVDRAAPGPEGGVVRALVLGDQRGVDEEIRRVFARTGTAHVLSVSGLHVTMVAAAAFALSRGGAMLVRPLAARASTRVLGALAALPVVAGYSWLARPAAPILRSAVMAAILLLGIALRRRTQFPTTIAVAAIVVGAWEPQSPWDLSAQLSFVTLLWIGAGMRLAAGGDEAPSRAEKRLRHLVRRAIAVVKYGILTTLLATLGAAPILARHFGEVSVIGIVANLLVVPVMGWGALGLGLLGAAVLPCLPGAAGAFFAGSGQCVRVAIAVAARLAEVPGATAPIGWRLALIGWAAATAAALPAVRRGSRVRRAVLVATSVGLLLRVADAFEPRLRIRFLDVGQGDAALVEVAGRGPKLFVDGGGFANGREPGARVLLPALRAGGVQSLDALVVSHPQWDHYGGFETVVREVETAAIWWSGAASTSGPWRRFRRAADARAVPFVRVDAAAGHPLTGWAPAHGDAEILSPSREPGPVSANDASLVLALRYGAFRALFTGDIEARAEAALLATRRDLAATVLKVPHHGSRTSSGARFVAAVRPVLAVASLGRNNPFRLPAPEVVARYRAYGGRFESTDRSGELAVETDGQLSTLGRCRVDVGSATSMVSLTAAPAQ